METTLSEQLARWVATLRYEDLPPAVVHHVRRCLIDYLATTIAGAGSRIARTLQTYLLSAEGGGEASLPGTRLKLSAANAAFANGTAASVLELDDGHALAAIHLGATALPAILATAQLRGATARDVIVATAAAYETGARLAIAARKSGERGFNATPLVGVFAAVAGTARILGSKPRAIAHALGLAGSDTGGLFDYHGGWLDSWCINVGKTARTGLVCAHLADAGIAGPLDIFHGPRGFAVAFTDGVLDAGPVIDGLGRQWLMLQTYVKPYPCCRRMHAVIDAVLALQPQWPAHLDAIDRILVETSAESARLDGRTFESVSAAQMSIPYGVAAALLFGPPRLEHFEEGARGDPRLLRLVERVDLRAAEDPAVTAHRSAARVSLAIAGEIASAIVKEPLGNPANPVDDQGLEAKFHGLVEPVIGRQGAARLARSVWTLGDEPGAAGEEAGLAFLRDLAPVVP
ncbi:MmgE/PrpD family protein [Bosea sp. (in: a-proteobacteria)]|uniref:MmgE/PrpD family protein n=1 Tax=Bosea sp. (in: a-proteobacteria) TaxID=1871050 RepID=UPI00262A378D|nr:MmgE/PrpD family protein [Bosea sp. (in: a-proteobacteria)]MCO5089842.1 MmgE/PrpD family protein [Bosea sp. (in: a-proteobacteria)]